MCEKKKEERGKRKYWFFGWHELPYFIAIIFGIILTIIGLVILIFFSPPIIDLVALFMSILGSLTSLGAWMSSLSKQHFDRVTKELRNEISDLRHEVREGFSRVESVLREIVNELRRRH